MNLSFVRGEHVRSVAALAGCVFACGGAGAQTASLGLANQAYVRLGSSASITPQQFTLEARFRADGPGYGNSSDSGGATILAKPRENGSGTYIMSWALDWSSFNRRVVVFLAHAYGSQGTSLTSNSTIAVGVPTHVAVTFDGTTIRMYINGALDASAPFGYTGVYYSAAEPVLIGAGNYGNGYLRRWQGMIDDVRIWDHARTQAQIAAGMGCEPWGSEAGLLASYDFTNDALADRSLHGHDGTGVGAVSFGPQAPGVSSPVRIEPIESQSGCVGTTVEFAAQASGSPEISYHWQIADEGGGWRTMVDGPVEGPGGEVVFVASGAGTSALAASELWGGGTGAAIHLRAQATNGCGTATSNVIDLRVCAGDFNCDGGIDGGDVDAFFSAWEAGDFSADINLDGGIDGADVERFFERWEGGC